MCRWPASPTIEWLASLSHFLRSKVKFLLTPTFDNRIHLSLDENGIHNWETIDILAQSIYTKNYIVEGEDSDIPVLDGHNYLDWMLQCLVTILPTVCHGASFLFFFPFLLDYITNPWMA